jgi:hypothetical protein
MTRIALLFVCLLLGNMAFSQVKLNIKWDKSQNLFYETSKLKKLPVTFENITNDFKTTLKKASKNGTVLKKIVLDKSNDGCHATGTFIFKKSPSEKEFKEVLESMNLQEFWVNNNRVLTKTLISVEEAHNKAMEFKFQDMTFNTTFNDSSRIEYYNFQVYYAGTKLQYMQGKNYPKYLYEGYIAKFTEQLEHYTQAREEFVKRHQKK